MKNIIKTRTLFGAGLTALAFSSILSSTAFAQTCAVVPTCEELGYNKTESECSGFDALKCPFDKTKFYCPDSSGNNGGCTSPNVGDILYSDMSCGTEVVSGKAPIGVVFEPDRRLAIALKTEPKLWMGDHNNVGTLADIRSTPDVIADWQGKNNTKLITTFCTAKHVSCPAFDYVNSYSTSIIGATSGDWYLPAMGELNAIYENKSVLNVTLSKIGGMTLPDSPHWSSSENDDYFAWNHSFSDGYNISGSNKHVLKGYVRPVLAF